MTRHTQTLVVVGMLLCTGRTALGEAPMLAGTRVRPVGENVRKLLQDGLRQSQTITNLVGRLERSDLIVYVRFAQLPPDRFGATQLLAFSAGTRFVLVTVSPLAAKFDLVARLGHELQHAAEIADAPGVQDEAGMRALFRRIGWPAGPHDTWETQAAVELGRRVLEEVYTRPAHASAALLSPR